MTPKASLEYSHKNFIFRSRKMYLNSHSFEMADQWVALNNSISADIQNFSILTSQEPSFPHLHEVGEHFSGKENF